jgi:molybdopterin molybdotransferase
MTYRPTLAQMIHAWPLHASHYRPDHFPVNDAVALLSHIAQYTAWAPDAVQQVHLQQGLGRVLAHHLVAQREVPPHDNAAMDGYALHSQDLQVVAATHEVKLQVVATVWAGQRWNGTLAPGECIKIMTGAALPAAVDTVVPHEQVQYSADPVATIRFHPHQVHAGSHCRRRGEDWAQGSVALTRGTILTPAALGVAASFGEATLPVMQRLRVAYFSTGNEIMAPTDPWRADAIYDSNRSSLCSLLAQLGCEVIDQGAVPDDPQCLQRAFETAQAHADVIITTGGASTGEADMTSTPLAPLAEVLHWKLAMRPGRPLTVGRYGKALLLGLPGNPVAAMVSFLVLVRPTLLRMMGAAYPPRYTLQARSAGEFFKKPGRTEFVRGALSNDTDGTLLVHISAQQGSSVLRSMVQADCLVRLPHALGTIAAGEMLEVWLLHNRHCLDHFF